MFRCCIQTGMKVWTFVTLSRLLYDFPFILCKRIQSLLFYNLFRILKVVQCVPAKSLILCQSGWQQDYEMQWVLCISMSSEQSVWYSYSLISGEGGIMEEQERTADPTISPVDEGDPSVVDLSLVDHNDTETTVSNSATNPYPIEADVSIQTLVNEMFSGHTSVESTLPQKSGSDAKDLCPFCGLMLHRKNLQVHLRRKHPDQVSNQEKPAFAQVKNPKQQRLPLRHQQKVREVHPLGGFADFFTL